MQPIMVQSAPISQRIAMTLTEKHTREIQELTAMIKAYEELQKEIQKTVTAIDAAIKEEAIKNVKSKS